MLTLFDEATDLEDATDGTATAPSLTFGRTPSLDAAAFPSISADAAAFPALTGENSGMVGVLFQSIRTLWQRGRQPTKDRLRALRIVDSVALGGQRQLTLVAVGEQMFLVGSGANHVQTIVPVIPRASGPEAQQCP